MTKTVKTKLLSSFVTAVGIAIVFAPFSILIGWNIFTMVLFWLIIIPILAIYLPRLVWRHHNHVVESIAGISIFYLAIVFMIYKHYKSDYFQMMIVSYFINILIIFAIRATTPTGRNLSS
jgi:hypothetical protein